SGESNMRGERLRESHTQFGQGRDDVWIRLIGVAREQSRCDKQGHGFVEIKPHCCQVLVADDAEASLVLPDWNANFAKQIKVTVDGPAVNAAGLRDLHHAHSVSASE